jgi:MFS family permease
MLRDDQIGLGTALFYLSVLGGSIQFPRVARRLGHRRITGLGVVGMGLYPLLLGFADTAWHFYVISLVGGLAWALAGSAYANYMLEHIPATDRPQHLAWYTVVLNAAVLLGSLGGPLIADKAGLAASLVLFGIARFAAGASILRWG